MATARTLSGTPLSRGYSLPPEWARHEATWFSWPRPEGISFPGKYHTVPGNIAAIIRQIVPRERVYINVPNENYQRIVTEQLIAGGVPKAAFVGKSGGAGGGPGGRARVRFFFTPTNESWCRDHGPAFVIKAGAARGKKQLAIVDWGFNAWGGKYPPYDSDDAVPTRSAEHLGQARIAGVFYPRHKGVPVVMEGGSIEVNGAGTLMTTEACLLHKNRNPNLTRKQIEKYLKDFYGQNHIVWLGEGIVGDDTDGHIDDLARFIAPGVVVTTVEDDPRDENYRLLRDNLRRLALCRDQAGRPFEVVELPMPGVVEHDGQRLPATYANFYFVNGAVLVPTYRHKKNDAKAIATLQAAMDRLSTVRGGAGKRRVIGVDCTELIWGLGAIHCLTQQMPAV